MKTQKGITLIALIITIIVMLILVGVSISVALNTGLFKAAQEAAQNTEGAKVNETNLSSGKVTIIEDGVKKEVDIKSFGPTGDVSLEPELSVGDEYPYTPSPGISKWRVIETGEKTTIAGVGYLEFGDITSVDNLLSLYEKEGYEADLILPNQYATALINGGVEFDSWDEIGIATQPHNDVQASIATEFCSENYIWDIYEYGDGVSTDAFAFIDFSNTCNLCSVGSSSSQDSGFHFIIAITF